MHALAFCCYIRGGCCHNHNVCCMLHQITPSTRWVSWGRVTKQPIHVVHCTYRLHRLYTYTVGPTCLPCGTGTGTVYAANSAPKLLAMAWYCARARSSRSTQHTAHGSHGAVQLVRPNTCETRTCRANVCTSSPFVFLASYQVAWRTKPTRHLISITTLHVFDARLLSTVHSQRTAGRGICARKYHRCVVLA